MIRTVLLDLPYKIKGFIRKNEDDEYICILNAKLNWETNKKTLLHELEHIKNNDSICDISVNEIELERHNG